MKSKYIKQIIKGCGEKVNFILILKWEHKDEALKKILEKCSEKQNMAGLYVKGLIDGIELNIFATGKILIRGIEDEEKLNKFLKEIFE
ncbi:MAG: hypothetical protein DRJ26_04775 [Candidatus Methanomethylicota archaeon]|uniref:Uncharacterized protein n=1 Tax=Thermoproteota archaeon TaxID=2056631 RepID=A0A497EZJ5_9CREN|nr:MAG: hypothetical protein DRJ26_04775 [Candidatus Verstraetearchaeota archaeon]